MTPPAPPSTASRWLHDLIDELVRERFYGAVEIKFESGHALFARKTETIKPPESNNRDSRGYSSDTSDR